MSKDTVSTKVSYVQRGSEIIGKDTTTIYADGSSKTVHANADMVWGTVYGGKTTGTTYNSPDGKSINKPS